MKKIYTYLFLAVGVAGLSGCNGDDIDYDNSIFFNEAEIANEAASKNSFDYWLEAVFSAVFNC